MCLYTNCNTAASSNHELFYLFYQTSAEQAADASPKKKSEDKAKKQPKEATSGSSESQETPLVLDPTVEANRMAEQLMAVRTS